MAKAMAAQHHLLDRLPMDPLILEPQHFRLQLPVDQ